jgi:hypothetical protein
VVDAVAVVSGAAASVVVASGAAGSVAVVSVPPAYGAAAFEAALMADVSPMEDASVMGIVR